MLSKEVFYEESINAGGDFHKENRQRICTKLAEIFEAAKSPRRIYINEAVVASGRTAAIRGFLALGSARFVSVLKGNGGTLKALPTISRMQRHTDVMAPFRKVRHNKSTKGVRSEALMALAAPAIGVASEAPNIAPLGRGKAGSIISLAATKVADTSSSGGRREA